MIHLESFTQPVSTVRIMKSRSQQWAGYVTVGKPFRKCSLWKGEQNNDAYDGKQYENKLQIKLAQDFV
jgi:hypothetical protein